MANEKFCKFSLSEPLNVSSVGNNTTGLPLSPFALLYSPNPSIWMRCVGAAVCFFSITFGGFGNLTTVLAFARNRKALWRRQYVNIAALAFSDTFVCLFSSGYAFLQYVTGSWDFLAIPLHCNIYWAIAGCAFYGSTQLIVLVGYDRFLIIKYGVDYERKETWRKVITRTLSFGLIGPLLSTPVHFMDYFTGVTINKPGMCLPDVAQFGFWYPLFVLTAFALPMIVMTGFYVQVYQFTRRHEPVAGSHIASKVISVMPIQSNTGSTALAPSSTTAVASVKQWIPSQVRKLKASRSRQHRATKILKYMFASIVISNLPNVFVTFVLFLIMLGAVCWDLDWWMHFYTLTLATGLLNNALNPVLYAYTMPKVNDSMVGVWRDAKQWVAKKLTRIKLVGTMSMLPLGNEVHGPIKSVVVQSLSKASVTVTKVK